MVSTVNGVELPSIREAFAHHMSLSRALKLADFNSIVPLMLLPREALLDIKGVAVSSASHISKTLKRYRLGHHVMCEKMSEFIKSEFGSVENAPIGVLQVFVLRNGMINRPVYSPLELITLLETCDPEMKVMELSTKSANQVRAMAKPLIDGGIQIHNLDEDIKHLASRLDAYGLGFLANQPADSPRLYAVS